MKYFNITFIFLLLCIPSINTLRNSSFVDTLVSDYFGNFNWSSSTWARNISSQFLISAPPGIKIPNRYIFHFSQDIPDDILDKLKQFLTDIQGQITNEFTISTRGLAVQFNFTLPVDSLQNIPYVECIEEDFVVEASQFEQLPSDGRFWSLDRLDGKQDNQYEFTLTGKGVNVYIVDSGVDETHPEFTGRAKSAYVVKALQPSGSFDCTGHGTHVAGIAGGNIVGVAKEINILAVRVIDCNDQSSNSELVEALEWIASNLSLPAIINMSLGPTIDPDTGLYPQSPSLDAAIQSLLAKGVIVMAAAGNDNMNPCEGSPAGTSGVITVAATDSSETRSSFSNFGSCVAIFAPGNNILSSIPNGQYGYKTGTSQATPHVTGVGALALELNPQANHEDILNILTKYASAGTVKDVQDSSNFWVQTILNGTGDAFLLEVGDADNVYATGTSQSVFSGLTGILIYVGIGLSAAVIILTGLILAHIFWKRRARKQLQDEEAATTGLSSQKRLTAKGYPSVQERNLEISPSLPTSRRQLKDLASSSHGKQEQDEWGEQRVSKSLRKGSSDSRMTTKIDNPARFKLPTTRPPAPPIQSLRKSNSAAIIRELEIYRNNPRRKSAHPKLDECKKPENHVRRKK